MDEQLAQRITVALEQIALELGTMNDANLRKVAQGVQTFSAPVVQVAREAAGVVASYDGPFPPFQGRPAEWVCPIHKTSKTVPAGFSERTQKSYTAFTACAESGCNEKPPRGAAPARAMPPSQGPQGGILP